jgi:tetratricopeptide (TPR) repeat protein
MLLLFIGNIKSQVGYEKKFLRFFKAQSLAGKVNAFDTLSSIYKPQCYPLIKDELNSIREKAIADHKEDILDKLTKIEGEIYFLNKNYSKAIPIFTDLLARNKIKTLNDSVAILYILKNSYLSIRQLNKTVELHRILVGLLKRDPKISEWVLNPRLSTIYYEMQLYKECLDEQWQEFLEEKNSSSMFINFCNNRGLFWAKFRNQDSAIFWFKKAKDEFYKIFPDNKLSIDNEFTIGLI